MVMLYFSAQCRFSIFITNYFEKLILNYLTFVMFFQAAAVGGNVDLIKLLVVKGADVYAENEVCKYHQYYDCVVRRDCARARKYKYFFLFIYCVDINLLWSKHGICHGFPYCSIFFQYYYFFTFLASPFFTFFLVWTQSC